MSQSNNVADTIKVNAINGASLFAAWELAEIQAVLSIAVLFVSLIYTCTKLVKELKK